MPYEGIVTTALNTIVAVKAIDAVNKSTRSLSKSTRKKPKF